MEAAAGAPVLYGASLPLGVTGPQVPLLHTAFKEIPEDYIPSVSEQWTCASDPSKSNLVDLIFLDLLARKFRSDQGNPAQATSSSECSLQSRCSSLPSELLQGVAGTAITP